MHFIGLLALKEKKSWTIDLLFSLILGGQKSGPGLQKEVTEAWGRQRGDLS